MKIRLQAQKVKAVEDYQRKELNWNNSVLASHAEVDSSTITRFYQRSGQWENTFIKIIKALYGQEANWRDYGEYFAEAPLYGASPKSAQSIDTEAQKGKNVKYNKYTERFESLITQHCQEFVGRQFVFDRIDEIQASHTGGYICITGNPGDGKSAIASNYLQRYPDNNAFYFNIRKDAKTTRENYLKSLCGQLDSRFGLNMSIDSLSNWKDKRFLHQILAMISSRLRTTQQPLTLVIDALDEAEKSETGPGLPNPLLLPDELPEYVYCLFTRRKEYELQGLSVSNQTTIDLSSSMYKKNIDDDVADYLKQYLGDEKKGPPLWNRLIQMNYSEQDFVKIMCDKSNGNFMYLTLVTQEIATGTYEELENLNYLPAGLIAYYEEHWELLDMKNEPFRRYVLSTLLESSGPISLDTVRKLLKGIESDATTEDINKALVGWWQFLQKIVRNGNEYYHIYHESFREFLSERVTSDRGVVTQSKLEYFEGI